MDKIRIIYDYLTISHIKNLPSPTLKKLIFSPILKRENYARDIQTTEEFFNKGKRDIKL